MRLPSIPRARSGLAPVALVLALALLVGACGGSTHTRHTAASAGPQQAYRISSPGSTVRVVAAGDIACPPEYPTTPRQCQQDATAALAERLHPELVLPLGDTQYEDARAHTYAASYAHSWGALRSISRPTIGNHEYQDQDAQGYFAYFQGRQPGPPGYYRVQAGSWQIYLLNGNCGIISCADEAAWLDQEMAAHPSRCSLVTMHQPRYSSGREHGDDPHVIPLWRVALQHGNDLVLSGHDHDYERFLPMGLSGQVDQQRGMVEIVVGTGGRNLYHLGQRKPGSAFYEASEFGVLDLELAPSSYSWTFDTIDGQALDHGTRTCR
jgi:acid phosphatase type 7